MKRTTMYSPTGKKLYAVRDSKGRFKDIQTCKRAHGLDCKMSSAKEKRDKLLCYIVEFSSSISDLSDGEYKRKYNIALDKMWAKIDKLKLF